LNPQLYVKCPQCDGDGSVIEYLSCGCCATTVECRRCEGEGYIEYNGSDSLIKFEECYD